MKITIFGTGYVGLVTGACFANAGNHVLCVDIDNDKIQQLQKGISPIYEPGLDELVQMGLASKQLQFTTDPKAAVEHGEFIFIAVGTPSNEDGSADLQYVLNVANTIAQYINDEKIIINKSTVPIGTADKVTELIKQHNQPYKFSVVSNPEFLKEGSAIKDFIAPDRVVVGGNNDLVIARMKQLYQPFLKNDNFISMSVYSSELTKYTANAMLALRLSFMNEISRLAESVGADIEDIKRGIGSDRRIGPYFLNPGPGFGGSCFPKDVKALRKTAQELDLDVHLLNSIELVNSEQKKVLYNKIIRYFGNDLKGKCFALWGLAFKANTDDMRASPAITLLELLWQAGATIQAYDPEAMDEARKLFPEQDNIVYCDNKEAALNNADALIIVTDWDDFKQPDFSLIHNKLAVPAIFDGRNLYDWQALTKQGFQYYAIGRGDKL